MKALYRAIESIAYVAILLVAWWGAVAGLKINPLIIPSPLGVWDAALDHGHLLAVGTAITIGETLLGFALAIIAGVGLAIAVISSKTASRLVLPTLVAINSAPKVVFAPILVIWLGLGVPSKVGMAFLLAFFPVVINCIQGLVEVEPNLVDLYRLMQANDRTILRRVRLLNSVPYLLTGLKIALPLAIIGSVIGEFVAAKEGLGHQIVLAYSNFDTELVFAAVIVITLVSVLLFQILVWIERALLAVWPITAASRSNA
jgi:NitT/TauT family transport system permease protein